MPKGPPFSFFLFFYNGCPRAPPTIISNIILYLPPFLFYTFFQNYRINFYTFFLLLYFTQPHFQNINIYFNGEPKWAQLNKKNTKSR